MRVATVDGLVTLFYDGSKKLYNDELDDEWEDEADEQDLNEESEDHFLKYECTDNANWESWDL